MSILFTPYTIKQTTFRNRIVMPPMVRLAPAMPPDVVDINGCITGAVVEHYRSRARAGTAMIIVEATAVDPAGRVWRNGFNAYADEHTAGLAKLADCMHAEGAVAAIQLVHGGPQASARITGLDGVGPSAVALTERGTAPRALSVGEIEQIEQRFADAATRAVDAGFDVVELHGAHAYLLDAFLSTRANRRDDAYGGNIHHRMRMLIETCRLTRARIGARALLCCRISVFNKLDEGFGASDFEALVCGLEATGIDLLHLSTDGAYKGYFGTEKTIQQWARSLTRLPLIVAGGLGDARDAERLVSEGQADFAAVGTAMLQNPDWTRRAEEILMNSVRETPVENPLNSRSSQ